MSDRIIEEHYVENTWTCTNCRVVNRGRDMECESCGSPRDKTEMAEAPTNNVVTDPDLIKKAEAGPNRLCPYCDSQNRAVDGKCPQCGAVREPVRETSTSRRSSASTFSSVQSADSSTAPILILAAMALVLCAGYWIHWLVAPHKSVATVTARSWSITRQLLTRTERHGSDWGAPYGAFNTSCQTKYYGTQSCQPYSCNYRQQSYDCRPHDCRCSTYTTTKSMKNGFSKVTTHQRCDTCYDSCSRTVHDTCWHQCPVYRDWCEYDYYEWPVTQTLTTSGRGMQPITEPVLTAGENQRIEQSGTYDVNFAADDKSYDLKPARGDYEKYIGDSKWIIETTRMGGFKVIEEAQ